ESDSAPLGPRPIQRLSACAPLVVPKSSADARRPRARMTNAVVRSRAIVASADLLPARASSHVVAGRLADRDGRTERAGAAPVDGDRHAAAVPDGLAGAHGTGLVVLVAAGECVELQR